MEKIQSAIAKARAERRAKGHVPATQAQFSHRPYPDAEQPSPAWEGLELVEPSLWRLRSQRIVTLERGSEAAYFDKLRTRMLQQMQANGWRRVAITSPGAGSGKTTIALNLAFSISRQMRSRVILAETDLRKPSMRQVLRLKTRGDFADVIRGNASFADCAVRVRPNLALGVVQKPVAASAELLQDAGLASILDTIEADYDPTIMMFDLPPLSVCDDVMAFSDKVDCVMIVAAAEQTKMPELDACERELANATNVLGIVLNKCRYETEDNSYEYYG